jgi:alpha-D-xyloside xylohydrolase
MKLRLLLFACLHFTLFNAISAELPAYKTTPDGVIIFTDPQIAGASNAVKLEVISDNIIRVKAAPGKEMAPTQSLVTVYRKRPDLSWNVVSSKETVTLKTKNLNAVVDLKTGAVSFLDREGRKILNEKQPPGRSFQPAVFDGKRYYNITQTFQTTNDDAWYGLGHCGFPKRLLIAYSRCREEL